MKLDYDYINPITGKKTVIMEGDRMLCVETGYHTFKGWNEVGMGDEVFFNSSPKSVRNSRFVDDLGQVWYKITLFTDSIVLYPTLYDGWEVNQFRDLEEGEEPKDKLQRIQNGKIQIIDAKNAIYFHEFVDALAEFDKRRLEQKNEL